MKQYLLFKVLAMVAFLMCSSSALAAVEAYANYTSSNKTLTFYYDDSRSSRTGKTYNLNTGTYSPGWQFDGNNILIEQVVFDPSFAQAKPISAYCWFSWMIKLESITGIQYLNTAEVTTMNWMFQGCTSLTSLDVSGFNTDKVNNMNGMFAYCPLTSIDVSNFNTSKVKDMSFMFSYCSNLTTIYIGRGWSTKAVTHSTEMFVNSPNLMGSQGTTYDANHVDAAYAHIDWGQRKPGYLTAKSTALLGDVDGDSNVNVADVTAIIEYMLNDDADYIDLDNADCDHDGNINVSDLTALIDYLLNGNWY